MDPKTPKESNAGEGAESKPEGKAKPELTPEEQMAKFEEDLKENDWGHQPC
jgi:hypothetical protein